MQGGGLYIDNDGSGGSLAATSVNFQNSRVELDKGAGIVSLSGNHFLTTNVYVDPALASYLSGNTFPPNSTIGVLYGTLTTAATFPLFPTSPAIR